MFLEITEAQSAGQSDIRTRKDTIIYSQE